MEENKKQRILMVHNYYQIPGGEDTVVANEKRMLEEHGHVVILYSRHNSEIKQMSKLQKLGLPFTTIFNPRTYREIKNLIKQNQIDIVHVHNTLNLVSPAVYYAALKCGVPVVQTVHNFRLLCPGATFYRDGHICEDCVEHGLWCAVKHKCYRGSRMQTLACVISTAIHRMTGVYGKINYICLTEFNKEKLLKLKQMPPDRVFIKPNFTFESTENLQGGERADYYLFVGRIEEIKGIQLLLSAFSKMPKMQLLVAGDGPLLDEKREWVKARGLDNVLLLGYIDHQEIAKLISECKAVIVPSQIYETFGMVIIESYAAHKPVITGDIGNIGSLVEEGITGLKYKYDDEISLMNAVMRSEQMDMDCFGEKAYKKYLQEFSPFANYHQLMEIYRRIV